MKILILANDDNGLYLFRRDLILQLLKTKNEIIISVPEGMRKDYFESIGCTFIATPVDRRGINPKTDFTLFQTYRKLIKDVNPDLVITYTIKPNIYGGIASRLAKKRYAVNITGLGTAFENAGMIRTVVVNLYKFALKKAKIIFFENSSNRDELLSFGCCKEEKTVVLNGAGVNTEHYSYQTYPKNEKVKFLFIGRVMKEKGIDELFAAMQRLVAEGQKCFLDVVGPFEEDYKAKLEQYEAEGWLKYHGFQEDVRPFIAACDCFVLPSYHEGMANTNLECASSGRALITSDIPGCREAVIKDVSGFLCNVKDADDLYLKMKEFLALPIDEREQMGMAGRKHMEDVFAKVKVVDSTVRNLY